jgi:xylulokinase
MNSRKSDDRLLLGIDVGTTGAKAALFSPEGELLAVGEREYGVSFPRPGWAEQNPEDWWEAVCVSVRRVLEETTVAARSGTRGGPRRASRHGAKRVAALAVSSQAPVLVPMANSSRGTGKAAGPAAGSPHAGFEVVRPALIWMDRRAEVEAGRLREMLGEGTIEKITGNRPDPFYIAAKLLWFKNHEPSLFSKTALVLMANGYINYRLTGRAVMDNVHAALLQLRDWRSGEWSEELCRASGADPSLFPPVFFGHEIVGEVTPEAARETGIPAGTPVTAGTVDGAAAALEAGAVASGTAAEMTGTSTVLLMPDETGVTEPAFIAMPHAIPGVRLLLGAMSSSGASLRWFRDQFGQQEIDAGRKAGEDPYDILTRDAERAPAGCEGLLFLPYMMGERSPLWDSDARGVFFGLSLKTTKGALVRAILEGTAFALRHNVDTARKAGVSIHEIRSVGGGTRSALWNRIKADILGVPILLPRTTVGAVFGDAFLAGLAAGVYRDARDSIKRMVRIRDSYEPDPRKAELYAELYSLFRRLYEDLKEDFRRSARFVESLDAGRGA